MSVRMIKSLDLTEPEKPCAEQAIYDAGFYRNIKPRKKKNMQINNTKSIYIKPYFMTE